MSNCLHCSEIITGRSDKKFCSPYCKSAYHYKLNKTKESSLFNSIDRQLKTNRRLLKIYNKAGKSTVLKDILIAEGFNPRYFTNYWKAQNGNIYLFCYEFGFMELKEKHGIKYVLIRWQPFMNQNN